MSEQQRQQQQSGRQVQAAVASEVALPFQMPTFDGGDDADDAGGFAGQTDKHTLVTETMNLIVDNVRERQDEITKFSGIRENETEQWLLFETEQMGLLLNQDLEGVECFLYDSQLVTDGYPEADERTYFLLNADYAELDWEQIVDFVADVLALTRIAFAENDLTKFSSQFSQQLYGITDRQPHHDLIEDMMLDIYDSVEMFASDEKMVEIMEEQFVEITHGNYGLIVTQDQKAVNCFVYDRLSDDLLVELELDFLSTDEPLALAERFAADVQQLAEAIISETVDGLQMKSQFVVERDGKGVPVLFERMVQQAIVNKLGETIEQLASVADEAASGVSEFSLTQIEKISVLLKQLSNPDNRSSLGQLWEIEEQLNSIEKKTTETSSEDKV